MLVQAAEESYKRGMRALKIGHRREALAYFEAAVTLESKAAIAVPQARYLSYYGLCQCEIRGHRHEAVQLCRTATTIEPFNPDLHWNLGRALFVNGRRKEAFRAFVDGLRIQSDHPGIMRDLKRMGLRQRPALPFLSRTNPINVLLGRMRRAA